MAFIGIALLIAGALALVVIADAGALVGLSQFQTAQVLPLLLLLVIFAGGLFSRRRRASELFGNLAIWIGIAAVAGLGYVYRYDLSNVAWRVAGQFRPGVAVVDAERGTATFSRGLGGHFEVRADINGHITPLIFDTGASAVVLNSTDAAAAGIDIDRLRFNIPVSTANGTGQAAFVTLDRMEVGGIVRTGVRAFVTSNDSLEKSSIGHDVSGDAEPLLG
ncbi:TIGR02281 family clan AA aspartic protease [Devosia algicola]|uniref:TIGR02281 family clan AA aspartic protease n=1 Tax=Devosia algicola TaxID=3026418 RepID=A0ABY7YNC7_9HYPH|nr:TIGR02281 family clan AA aspartic protease [Devosia algicola]WDR02793.1 TIGR02281 family clan AA aspartic protease [Devosia algicola]